jgi:hypothetical protein
VILDHIESLFCRLDIPGLLFSPFLCWSPLSSAAPLLVFNSWNGRGQPLDLSAILRRQVYVFLLFECLLRSLRSRSVLHLRWRGGEERKYENQFEEEGPAGGIFYPRPAHKKGVGEEEQGKLTDASCWMLVTWPPLCVSLSGRGSLEVSSPGGGAVVT